MADAESGILERAITANNESWSPEAARAILAFKLADVLICAAPMNWPPEHGAVR